MKQITELDAYRTGYISTLYNVSDNCARALQLFEIGYTQSGAAQILGLNQSTVRNYAKQLQSKIGEDVVAAMSPMKPTYDIFGFRRATDYSTKSYNDGVADAEMRLWQIENS